MTLALDRYRHRSRTFLETLLLIGALLSAPLHLASTQFLLAVEEIDDAYEESDDSDEQSVNNEDDFSSLIPQSFAEEVDSFDPIDLDLIDDDGEEVRLSGLEQALADEAPTDELVQDLERRLADLEKQIKKQTEAEQKANAAAAKKFVTRPFGRIHADAASFDQSQGNIATVGNALNGIDIRRARLGVEGEGFDTFFYRFDVDFVTFDPQANTRPIIVDAYIDTLHLPVLGNIRAGHFREPFSLERLSSTHDLPFLERSAPINTLTPFRNMGIMQFGWNEAETRTWAHGIFAENTNELGEQLSDRTGIAFTTRHTWLPYYDDLADGRYLLHFGLSYSYRKIANYQRQFSSTPEVILKQGATIRTPNFVNTGTLALDDYQIVGTEFSNLWGSLSFQGEYVAAMGNQLNGDSMFLNGGYLEMGYFLTGEHKNYNRQQGIYGGTALHNNFFRVESEDCICTGTGAWEFVTRVTNIDLTNNNVNGGVMTNFTVGLNWYYAYRSRVMFDFIHSNLDRNNIDSYANIFATRFQYAF